MRSLLHCLLIACLMATISATNATETSATTEAAAAADTTEAPAAPAESPISQPQIEITKLELNEHELEALLQLDEAINEQQKQEQLPTDDKQPQRAARHIKDEQLTKEAEAVAPSTLSDDDINAIMQMIKFPADGQQQEVMKLDNETNKVNADEIEPRQSGNRQGRGYYILAFAPANDDDEVAEQEQLNYNRIDIIPEERFSGKVARYYKQEKREEKGEEAPEQSHRTEDYEEEAIDDDEDYDLFGRNAEALDEDEAEDEVEARFISMKQLNRYIRRLMRQIRKGTRKITRKTRVKKKSADPTVENFLKGLYKARQQKKAKKNAWFSW